MSPASPPNAPTENVALLEGHPDGGLCCRRYRMYGSDSVWSWVVAVANFLINFLIVGLGRMSGILYVEFMNVFDIDRKTASIPFSVQQAARNLFGPLAGLLGQKYGLRDVTILGGVIASLSASLLFFKMDLTSITILWGLLFGISAALTTTLNQVSIDQYFERNRATAGGFAFSGGCVGAFFFPALIETSIAHYELKGTFFLLGAILLGVIPAAIILVDPPWKEYDGGSLEQNYKRYGSMDIGELRRRCAVKGRNSVSEKTKKKLPEPPKNIIRIDFGMLRENSDVVFQLLTKEISNESTETDHNISQKYDKTLILNELEHIYFTFENPEMQLDNLSTRRVLRDSVKTSIKIEKKSFTKTNADGEIKVEDLSKKYFSREEQIIPIQSRLQELYERKGSRVISHFNYDDQPRACKILTELRKLYEILTEEPYIQTIHNKAQHSDASAKKEKKKPPVNKGSIKHSNSFYSHIKTAVKLHGNPLFLLICLSRGVFMLTFIPVVTVIVDFTMDQGLERSQGKYAIAALSLGDFLGRLCLGWITDRGYISQPKYMLIVMILLSGNTAALPLLESEIPLLAAVLTFGVLQGSLYVKHPMLISQYMKRHEQSIGMGFINFLSGIVGFALPAFIGYFRDTLGSYREMFYVNGIICGAVGVLWGLEPFLSPST